ncbi:MAG: alanyl-tRNA editing protein [Gemmatimonadetes bacterium]|nr:alanyl-tRNA editing protein [Gemmatimonadota bacterium]
MTERLYYTDAYCSTFTARVVDRAEDGRRVWLDRSAFYPTSGGQPHDLGTLEGVPVVDVVDEDERVAHLLERPLAATTVTGTVDWARRFDFMQQHTGQHLLSAIFADRFGWETLSVHFGADYATMDLGVEVVPPAAMVEAAELANAAIVANHAVSVSFEDAATAQGLRKPTDRAGSIRIVTIHGLDRSACGGTHVRATGEIGGILLRRQEKMKKNARIEFLCGHRAMRRARADYEVLVRMAAAASASIDELPALVAAQVAELKASDQARRKLEDEVAAMRARTAWEGTAPDAAGMRWHLEVRPAGRADEARAFAIAFAAQPRAAYLLRCDEPRAVLLATSTDSGIDAGQVLKGLLPAHGGKGGGSPRLAQGSLPDAASLAATWDALGALRTGTT